MAALRLKGALWLGVLASLAVGSVSADANFTGTYYSELDMSRVQESLMAGRPGNCPPW